MKIERISDNQIRCTLSKHDLMERHLKISELAYGSEKAKDLFRDMMEQANIDFGFDADDIPLMIEAIPTSRDSIVLVITKVENQDEFDEKFSRFGIHENDSSDMMDEFDAILSDAEEDDDEDDIEDYDDDEADDMDSPEIVDCFEQLHDLIEEAEGKNGKADSSEFIPLSEAIQKNSKKKKQSKKKKIDELNDRTKVYSFISMNPIIQAAHVVTTAYTGKNTLWKDSNAGQYFLLINRGNSKTAFRSACSAISEFGKEETITYASQDYYNEHFQVIIKDKALSQLAML